MVKGMGGAMDLVSAAGTKVIDYTEYCIQNRLQFSGEMPLAAGHRHDGAHGEGGQAQVT